MSVTFEQVPPRGETARLQERVNRLRSSMEWARDAIPPAVRDEVARTVARCDERLALGVDHTVVALAGGTGSGKSSLFNAISATEFAVAGVARPTTSQVSAATWTEDSGALLDWLGVDDGRRVRGRYPSGTDETSLRGLVLLDLPDHDSVNGANREVVDRLVPQADLLVWVVDPQKYADHALHSAYLRVASQQGQPSLVALNQVDRLSTEDGWAVARDLQALLAEDGMISVPVIPVSARRGDGLDILRAEIAGAVASRTVAAEAVRADLVAAGTALAGALAKDAEPTLPDVTELLEALARVCGVDARADAAASVAGGRSSEVVAHVSARVAAVERERLDWVDAAAEGLPRIWHSVVDSTVADAESLAADLNAALAGTPWPHVQRPHGWRVWVSKVTRVAAVRKATLAVGREAIKQVVLSQVVEPTERIHQAYRVLDELTELD